MNNTFQRNNFGMNNFSMMGTGPINQIMPVNTMNPQNMMQMQQHQMQMQMIQQSQMNMNMQMQHNMNLLNQQKLMNRANQILNSGNNINNAANSDNSGNQNNDEQNNLNINFYVVPESNLNDESNKITMQVKKEEKINEIYKKLLGKLITNDQNYIKKIVFNNNEISKTSTQKASEFNFTNDCKVIAIKNEAVAN